MATTLAEASPDAALRDRARKAERLFFTGMAASILVAVFVGFSPTFYLRPWLRPDAPGLAPLVHVHGAVFTAWVLLFMTQAGLISARRVALHRRLGVAGFALAVALAVTGLAIAVYSAQLDHRPPGWPSGAAFFANTGFQVVEYAALLAAALAWRRHSDWHKRLMLLATVVMLTPALTRIVRITQPDFLPEGVYGAQLLVVPWLAALVLFDLYRLGRLHQATIWGLVVYAAFVPPRLMLGFTEAWQGFAGGLLGT